MFSDTAVQSIFAQWIQNSHVLASGGGLTLPALKKLLMRLVLKQRSVAHMPQRWACGRNRLSAGISAASSRGSSKAAAWLLTVIRPCPAGRW